jgi:regulator of cell morphogenesis and NO signaling
MFTLSGQKADESGSLAAPASISLPLLLAALEEAIRTAPGQAEVRDRDWYAAPLAELVSHIVEVHHGYLRQALPRLRLLTQKVLSAHGAQHGEMLRQVQDLFRALDAELTPHLMKEEEVLFPFIVALEVHVRDGAAEPSACFGSVRNPIRQMEHEHESAGATLAKLRTVTAGYALPPDACPTFAAMYEEFQQMEADLHQHIHLENNILFPRAGELENSAGEGGDSA